MTCVLREKDGLVHVVSRIGLHGTKLCCGDVVPDYSPLVRTYDKPTCLGCIANMAEKA